MSRSYDTSKYILSMLFIHSHLAVRNMILEGYQNPNMGEGDDSPPPVTMYTCLRDGQIYNKIMLFN